MGRDEDFFSSPQNLFGLQAYGGQMLCQPNSDVCVCVCVCCVCVLAQVFLKKKKKRKNEDKLFKLSLCYAFRIRFF